MLVNPNGLTKISRRVLTGAEASVSFSTIPATYGTLLLMVYARGDTAAVSTGLYLQFNGDTAGNYDRQVVGGVAATPIAAESLAQTQIVLLGTMPAASATANLFASGAGNIPQYAGTVGRKMIIFQGYQPTTDATGGKTMTTSGGEWRSTAAITSILLYPAAGNFIAGSAFSLYGLEG